MILFSFFTVGYTVRDVMYIWNDKRQVAIAEDMKLSQFDLIATPSGNETDLVKSGIFILQVPLRYFTPISLHVMVSPLRSLR